MSATGAGPPTSNVPAPADPVTRLTPVQIDTGRIVAVGTAAFAAVFVVLVVARLVGADWTHAHTTWIWTTLAGWVLGLMGLVIIGRHRRLGRTR